MLTTKAGVFERIERIAKLLPEYETIVLDADSPQLSVRNVTLGVLLLFRFESSRYWPYLATSDSEEMTETGMGLKVIPRTTRQTSDDAEAVAANIRTILGDPSD